MIILFDRGKFGKAFGDFRRRMKLDAEDITAKTGLPRYVMYRIEAGMKVGADSLMVAAYFSDLNPMDFIIDEDGMVGQQLQLKLPKNASK